MPIKHLLFFTLLCVNVNYINAFSSTKGIQKQGNQKKLFKKALYFYQQQQQDSALTYFIKSKKEFLRLNDSANIAKCYNNIAKILLENNDLVESEYNTINAIKYYSNNITGLFKSYNRLGIISKKQGLYEESIKNHQKAFELIKFSNDRRKLEIATLTNIANTYQKMGDYKKAIDYYNNALLYDSVAIKHPKKYARIIDSKAYSNLLNGNKKPVILNKLLQSLNIKQQINDASGSVVSAIHIANYYLQNNNFKQALPYAQKALLTAKNTTTDDYKLALFTLAKVDVKNSTKHLKNYIKLTDSLLVKERSFKNSFAKIKYETEQKEQENTLLKNKALEQEKKELLLLVALGVIFAVFVISLFFYKQRQKTQQQLSIIEKLQAKEDERNRLAGNVHDAFAGYLRKALTQLDNLNIDLKNNKLEEIGDTLETAYNKARNISQEYQKLNFDAISFEKYMQSFVIEKEDLYKIKIEIDNIKTIDWKTIHTEIKTEFYRILQEVFLNIHKHANAKNAIIRFNLTKNALTMCIEDNGIGMELYDNFESVGLLNIKQRVNDLNGNLQIKSNTNKGFELQITVPI